MNLLEVPEMEMLMLPFWVSVVFADNIMAFPRPPPAVVIETLVDPLENQVPPPPKIPVAEKRLAKVTLKLADWLQVAPGCSSIP